ncbi:hypothetical protein F4803DRAFT_546758 [Xylaria telfairii]|nr:hypothetical protein F4803DRAFT_546758 [Xylaria telfairii]
MLSSLKMSKYSSLSSREDDNIDQCYSLAHDSIDDMRVEGERVNRSRRGCPWASKLSSRLRAEYILLLLVINLVLLVANVTGYLPLRASPGFQYASSSLRGSIRYQDRHFELLAVFKHDGSINPHKSNSFNGPPRPELDEAWDDLMKSQNLRVSDADIGQFSGDDTIVQLTDGSGYFVTLAVYHGLHCVQRLHHYIYKDHYYGNLTDWEMFTLKRHTEHCLDWLRQYLQCNVDTTLIPIRWNADTPGPVSKDLGKHQCVAWEPVEEWADKHTFNPFEPGLVVHPIFGSPYENHKTGSSHNLGATEQGKGGFLHTALDGD